MEDGVILDVMDDVFLTSGRYTESFVVISLLQVCQEGGSRMVVLEVILDVMDDVFLPQGRYPESFIFISSLEVCQEGGGAKKVGTWRTLMVPDRRHGGPGHP